MLLWKKLWYYVENYGTYIYDGKNMVDYQKLRNFNLYWKKHSNNPKQWTF